MDWQLDLLRDSGMCVVCFQNETGLRHRSDTNIIAWMQEDEPDNARNTGARFGFGSPTTPKKIISEYRRMKSNDVSRPVLLNLGQGVAWDGWIGRGNRNNHPEDYPRYLEGCDIASFDFYPVNTASREVAGKLWKIPEGLERLVRWTDGKKPVWSFVECTRIENLKRKPTPQEVRAEVWMALIHGARGVVYFAHQFKPRFIEAALLEDSEMLRAVGKINARIAQLAPALNSESLKDAVKVECSDPGVPVAMMVKQWNGAAYIFAVAMRDGTTRATFHVTVGGENLRAEVLDEDRAIEIKGGNFSDDFREWDVHLYRLTPTAR